MVQTMNRDLVVNDLESKRTAFRYSSIIDKMYQPGRELWEKVPSFQYEFFHLGRVLANYSLSLLYLAMWTVGSVWLAARNIARLEVF
jgi:hypothetical protein